MSCDSLTEILRTSKKWTHWPADGRNHGMQGGDTSTSDTRGSTKDVVSYKWWKVEAVRSRNTRFLKESSSFFSTRQHRGQICCTRTITPGKTVKLPFGRWRFVSYRVRKKDRVAIFSDRRTKYKITSMTWNIFPAAIFNNIGGSVNPGIKWLWPKYVYVSSYQTLCLCAWHHFSAWKQDIPKK